MNKLLLALALGAAIAPAHAEETAAADTGWKGTGEFGLAISKGNTDSQTVIGKLGVGLDTGKWKHAASAAFLYGKQDDLESARRYEITGSTGYRLTDRSYLFGAARNERDHFASNEYQWTATAGYGFEAIKNDTTHLNLEVGPGYRWSKLQGVRVHQNEAIVRGFVDFGHQLTDTTSVYDTLLVEAGRENTYARNDIGVQVKMSDALALKAGFETRHNTDVLPGLKKTDTLTTVNVVYGF